MNHAPSYSLNRFLAGMHVAQANGDMRTADAWFREYVRAWEREHGQRSLAAETRTER
jgi:hypothetical protein